LPAETISAAASEPNVHKERSRHKTPTVSVFAFAGDLLQVTIAFIFKIFSFAGREKALGDFDRH